MKILSIGNSYSEDAQRYLHSLAEANGRELMCVNLYIGGCPLSRHYANLTDGAKAYDFQHNGENTHIKVSIEEAVQSNAWDCITLQQVSPVSFDIESYTPYLERITAWLRASCPSAAIGLHQTWAYPENRERLPQTGFSSTEAMFSAVKDTYAAAAVRMHADFMIKSGEAMLQAYRSKPDLVYRDAIHASRGFGRYLLACVWYKALLGESPSVFLTRWDEEIAREDLRLILDIIEA